MLEFLKFLYGSIKIEKVRNFPEIKLFCESSLGLTVLLGLVKRCCLKEIAFGQKMHLKKTYLASLSALATKDLICRTKASLSFWFSRSRSLASSTSSVSSLT